MKRALALLCAALCLMSLLTACGGSAQSKEAGTPAMAPGESYYGGAAMDSGEFSAISESTAMTPEAVETRKIIRTASLRLESKEFDAAVAALEQKAAALGGWVESSSIWGGQTDSRSAEYTLRIPAGRLEEFLSGAGEIGNVLNVSRSSEEITDRYYDVDAHLKALRLQEDRLLDILEKADSLEYVIQLESELTNVRYQIESLTGTLRRFDSQVEMSTVNVTLREVRTATVVASNTLGERIARQFQRSARSAGDFLEELLVFLIGDFPILALWAVALVAIFLGGRAIIRRLRRRAPGTKKLRTRKWGRRKRTDAPVEPADRPEDGAGSD